MRTEFTWGDYTVEYLETLSKWRSGVLHFRVRHGSKAVRQCVQIREGDLPSHGASQKRKNELLRTAAECAMNRVKKLEIAHARIIDTIGAKPANNAGTL